MLLTVLQLVRRGWRAILVIFLAVTAVSVAAAVLITPVYQGDVLVSYIAEDESSSGLASLASQFSGIAPLAGLDLSSSSGNRAEAVAILSSRQLSVQFIEQHNLLPALFPDWWDAQAGSWRVAESEVPTMADGFQVFDEDVREVAEDKTTGLIRVSIAGHQRERVAEWANALVRDANEQIRQRALRESQYTIKFLQNEFARTELLEIRQAISRVLEAEISKATLANVREEFAFRVIDPAVTPESDEFVWPNRPLVIGLGIVLGLALGFAYVLLREELTLES